MSRRKLGLKRVGYIKPLRLIVKKRVGYIKPLRLVFRYRCKGKDKNRV